MEITTIVGIVVAIIIIGVGLKMVLRKSNDAAPSLDSELHINQESQQPVIPRHVRDQLQAETPVATPEAEAAPIVAAQPQPAVAASEPEQVVAVPESSQAVVEKEQLDEAKIEEPKLEKSAEFSLNSNIEKAEIAEFSDESSILDAHLHEQQLVDEESALATAEDFVALNVYPERRLLTGEKTLKVLMKYGLRYGEMACFHRYNEDGTKLLFSVLQVTDEGASGFDLEALSTEEVKGLAFFLALPHNDVQNAFDTMVSISGLIAREVEGTVYDQNNQEFTPQLREHWRHQAIDYRSGQTAQG
jgi:cell division protein ZipA